MNFVETHGHFDDDAFAHDLAQVFDTARAAGVRRFINIGYEPESWVRSLALAQHYPDVSYALGMHPNSADRWTNDTALELERLLGTSYAGSDRRDRTRFLSGVGRSLFAAGRVSRSAGACQTICFAGGHPHAGRRRVRDDGDAFRVSGGERDFPFVRRNSRVAGFRTRSGISLRGWRFDDPGGFCGAA